MRTAIALAQRAYDAMEPNQTAFEEPAEQCRDIAALWYRAGTAFATGQLAAAWRLLDEARALADQFGDYE